MSITHRSVGLVRTEGPRPTSGGNWYKGVGALWFRARPPGGCHLKVKARALALLAKRFERRTYRLYPDRPALPFLCPRPPSSSFFEIWIESRSGEDSLDLTMLQAASVGNSFRWGGARQSNLGPLRGQYLSTIFFPLT